MGRRRTLLAAAGRACGGVLCVALLLAAVSTKVTITPGAMKAVYPDFESFYPFYLSQHADCTNRILHVVGTSGSVAVMVSNPAVAVATVFAGITALAGRPLFVAHESGALEALLAVCAFVYVARALKAPWKAALAAVALGYGFAWCVQRARD